MPTPERKLTQARIGMQLDHPFFGFLAMGLEPVAKTSLKPPTMATDGSHLFYHPDFVNNTSLKELMGVIAHEVGHVILKHLIRRMTREPLRWNIAADLAVNWLITQPDLSGSPEFTLPKGALHDDQYANKAAESIYNTIPVKVVDASMTLDDHGEWEGWGKGDGKAKDGDGGDGGDQKDKQAIGDDEIPDIEQQWEERVAQAVTQARMRGKLPGHIEELVGTILQPKLDWKTILRDMVTSCARSDFTMNPPNKKHIWRGIYLPGITGTEVKIACAIDSSGSISDQEISEFVSEIVGICDSYNDYTVWLYICDTQINQEFELHPGDPLPKTVQGRGGTDFRKPFEKAERDMLPITSFIYFTDLCGTFPEREPPFPVIWVATTDQPVPWGHVIRYPSKDTRD